MGGWALTLVLCERNSQCSTHLNKGSSMPPCTDGPRGPQHNEANQIVEDRPKHPVYICTCVGWKSINGRTDIEVDTRLCVRILTEALILHDGPKHLHSRARSTEKCMGKAVLLVLSFLRPTSTVWLGFML